jgi:hypothetical protein
MPRVRRRLTAAGIVLALAAGSCGGSSSSSKDIVARAAADTAQLAGYRVTGRVTVSSSASGLTSMLLAGTFDRTNGRGRLTTTVQLGSRRLEVPELVSPLAVYMGASVLPGGTRLTGGKPWVKLDLGHAGGAAAVGSLPAASDPTQFVDYLRAVSSASSHRGLEKVDGVPTAHYTATIDLGRYPALVAAAERQATEHSIRTLESALGSHKLPVDVWIDSHGVIRQLAVAFGECVARTRIQYSMSLDLYDFGPQSTPPIPPSHSVYDLTPLISRALSHARLGCVH